MTTKPVLDEFERYAPKPKHLREAPSNAAAWQLEYFGDLPIDSVRCAATYTPEGWVYTRQCRYSHQNDSDWCGGHDPEQSAARTARRGGTRFVQELGLTEEQSRYFLALAHDTRKARRETKKLREWQRHASNELGMFRRFREGLRAKWGGLDYSPYMVLVKLSEDE